MPRERGRRSFSLSDEAQAILDQVDNYSGYVDALIRQHARDWTEALARLLAAGLRAEEVESACEVLAGYGLGQWSRGGRFVAAELARAQERTRVFSEREVSTARRAKLLKQLASDNTLSTALAIVVREFHLPNTACRDAVRTPRTTE
jgi:hypothetical protein